jgi:hypothetical protein
MKKKYGIEHVKTLLNGTPLQFTYTLRHWFKTAKARDQSFADLERKTAGYGFEPSRKVER